MLGQLDGADDMITALLADEQASSTMLAVMAQVHTDAGQRAALAAEVQRRDLRLPEWLARLGSTLVLQVVELFVTTHVDTLAIELRLADGQRMTCLLRIDHQKGTIVSDAELIGTDLASVTRAVTVAAEFDRLPWRDLRPADARARLEFALTVPRPPIGVAPTEGVELLRPLLGWIVRLLPAGGEGYDEDLLELYREMARNHNTHHRFGHFDDDCCEKMDLQLSNGMRASIHGSRLLREVTALVGGAAQLESLDDDPLPDEPFDWSDVPDDICVTVQQVLELCDRACGQFFDVEIRTATRHLLHRVATTGVAAFRRKGSVHTAAAALIWVTASRNHLIGNYAVRAKDLNESLAVAGSSSSRAGGLLRAAGLEQSGEAPEFSALYLTGTRRARLIGLRDRFDRIPVHRLRVELDGVDPPIERTVAVLGDMPLQHVHDVIQIAFGWEGTRSARFEFGDRVIVSNDRLDQKHRIVSQFGGHADELYLDDLDDLEHFEHFEHEPARMDEYTLRGFADAGDTFIYRYGDWVHRVTVESVSPLRQTSHVLPHLVGATRAAPPDDIGGALGYQRLLDALRDGHEDLAGELTVGIVAPVLAGSFDPWRPDPEQARADAISRAMKALET